MNDLTVTVTGWVATPPVVHDLGDKGKMCAFRVGHTPRFRGGDGTWRDGDTEWIAVRLFRTGAQNVGESLHKGQPVVLHGRVKTHAWTQNDGTERTELQMDATVIGHDLTKGTARFTRTVESSAAPADRDDAPTDADGLPQDVDDADAVHQDVDGTEPEDQELPDAGRAAVLA